MRVLVTGGRDYADRNKVFGVLDHLAPTAICHGGARGADALAGLWAERRNVLCRVYPASWDVFGKRAGMVRNKEMLDDFAPDLVLAFPGGRGTEGMVTMARAAHVRVMQVL